MGRTAARTKPELTRYEQKRLFYKTLAAGATISDAVRLTGISKNTGTAWAKAVRSSGGSQWAKNKAAGETSPDPIKPEDYSDAARRATEDFGYFRRRYFGRIASPWQEQAAYSIIELLDTPQREYVVINCPPGAGKSTLFTHDIPAWLTVRNRAIRGLIGSRTEKQAVNYTGRLRRTFERTVPVQAEATLLEKGRALDAEATLVEDFGRFRTDDDLWRRDQFVVAQLDSVLIDEKESTWTAYGMDSGSLGTRVDFIIWDDLVDKTTLRTIDAVENQREWWENEAETRLEPDGLLILQGQRMSSRDLYRYCLDMRVPVDPEAELDDEAAPTRPKYHHILFRAHYEDRCQGVHKTSEAEAYPNGCLLDPIRLPWGGSGGLAAIALGKADKYRVVYQQEDVDPATILVQPIWIKGGVDEDGIEYQGCWDNDRDLCQLPRTPSGALALTPPLLSIATADPSPTKFWAIQWWVVHPDTQQRFLMDLVRRRMEAPDFLDRLFPSGEYVGVMEEWQQRSAKLSLPITHWIVEKNAAQRFMLQYNHTRMWQRQRNVLIVPHETGLNKNDPEMGVETIAPHYKFGRVRLPGKQLTGARIASMKLVDEVTRYPDSGTDDQVMAHWFLEWNLPKLHRPPEAHETAPRPSWLLDLVGATR